jgi:hypothetical protein
VTEQLELDLTNALMDRIRLAIEDTLDTARHGGVPVQDRMALALTALVAHTMTGALAAGYTEEETVASCLLAYRELKARKARKARAESQRATKPH